MSNKKEKDQTITLDEVEYLTWFIAIEYMIGYAGLVTLM